MAPTARGTRILMREKIKKMTFPRPNFLRSNIEAFVAINRSWLIYRKCKWINPSCKIGLRALDLRHIIHLFMFELSCGLFRIGDDWARRSHSLGDFCLNPFLLFFLFPPPPTWQTRFGLLASQPLPAISSPYISLVVVEGSIGMK